MSSEWTTSSLLDHYEVRSGLSKPAKDFGSGYPFLTFKDVFYNYFTPESLGDFVQSTEKEREGCSVLRGDVFLTRTSETMHELGMSCVALRDYKDATFNGFCKRLRPKPESDLLPEYVGYYLRSPKFRQAMLAMSTMSTRASLNNEMIGRLDISFPSRKSQIQISEVLKSLDDRITLLRETNATLEAIAQAQFKSWFVDFDPVRAKMEGRAPEGMDEATAALFPDGFETSELGEVPRGWLVQTFRDTIQIIGGGTPKTSNPDFWGGDIPWFSVVDAPGASDVFVIDTEKHITEAGLSGSSTKLLPAGTTIISARGTVGKLALTGRAMAMNQSCYGLRGKAGDTYFTYFSATRLVQQLQQRAHGSVFDTITQETFSGVHVAYPQAPVVQAFDTAVDALMARIRENLFQAQTLSTLRDTLLPRLISGQLSLPEAQIELKKAIV